MFRCADEVKALGEKLERERRQSEALAARVTDMESAALRRETDVSEMKRLIQSVNDEHQQLMKVRHFLCRYKLCLRTKRIQVAAAKMENCILMTLVARV